MEGKRQLKPKKSVIKPGVISKVAPTRIKAPSNNLSAGKRPS